MKNVRQRSFAGLPAAAGVSLKPQHFEAILESMPAIGFFEIHAENYMVDGGPLHHFLTAIRDRYPLSVHGVALSLGGEEDLDETHIDRLGRLIERYQPEAVSEHLAWSSHGGTYFNDLLPLAYDRTALERVCAHVDHLQNRLRRRILLENPSTYFAMAGSTMDEGTFVSEIIARTGCGLLLDVNNVHVSAFNNGTSSRCLLDALPLHAVGQIHVAGFTTMMDDRGVPVLIDSHAAPVDPAVWSLYAQAIGACGAMPTLLERDADVPGLSDLVAEAMRAEALMNSASSARSTPRLVA